MGRPVKSEIAPGVFSRGETFWLRYTPEGGGAQVRISLNTKDPAEAVRLANERRGKPLPGKAKTPKWDRAVAKYVKDGLESKKFRKNTADIVRYACKAFQGWSGVSAPEEVTRELLQEFYDLHSGYRKVGESKRKSKGTGRGTTAEPRRPRFVNVATAQGYASKVTTFLRQQGNLIRIDFRGSKPESRDVVVPVEIINQLVSGCRRVDLKYVLFAGFHAGFRKEEIIMSRPQWFKMALGHVAIPKIQTVKGRIWEVKSSRPRKVPLTPAFREFLEQEFGSWEKQTYMLHPEANGQRYRWDFCRPFTKYMAAHGLWKRGGEANVTPHSMRHTYITHLADLGYSAAQISAWSGDRIRTLETNYLHTSAPEGAVDQLYSRSQPTSLDTVFHAIQSLKDQLGEDSAKSIESLLLDAKERTAPDDAASWEWTNIVPENHRRLHTVESTVSDRETFQSVFDPDDTRISDYDWEEGRCSTMRARLADLKSCGWIRVRG